VAGVCCWAPSLRTHSGVFLLLLCGCCAVARGQAAGPGLQGQRPGCGSSRSCRRVDAATHARLHAGETEEAGGFAAARA
jgi:hypothetical protein